MSDGVVEAWARVKSSGRWSCWSWRVVRRVVVALKLSVLSKLSRSSSLLVSRYGKCSSKSSSSLSTRCRSCSTLQRSVVQRQLGRSLSTRSNTPRQQREEPTAIFWNFFSFMGVSPNFGWAPPNFRWNPEACPFELFVWSFYVFYGQFFVVTHFCRQ